MKILIIGSYDNGGASWWLSDAINKYTKHEARSIRLRQSYINYPFDIVAPTTATLNRMVAWADVIHARDKISPHLDLRGKAKVITFTGKRYRDKAQRLVPAMRSKGWLVTVSTPNLPSFYPKKPPIWLPNPREEMVAGKKHKRFTVCHAPTYRYRKGTETIIEALDGFSAALELIENTSYTDCIRRKAKCHVLLDQFRFGYGNNAIEAWALGMPVISGADDKIHKIITEPCGFSPYIRVKENKEEIRDTVRRLASDDKFYMTWAERGREYFYRFHHAPVVAKQAIKLYEMAKAHYV